MAGSITWRFALSGAAEARADLASLGDVGAAAAAQLDGAWGKSNNTTAASIEQFRQLRDAAAQAGAAANAANTNVQARVNQGVGVGSSAKPASSSASVFAAQFAEYDRQAEALRAKIDPAAAAQVKMNAAIAAAGTLLKTGTITEAEHAAAVTLAEKAYKDATTAVNAMGHATTGTSGIVREALVIMRELGRGDFSRLAGSATIEAQRLGLLQAILSPVGISVAAFTLAVIAAAVAEERWASSQERIVAALQGTAAASGASVAQINAIGDAQGRAGQISASTARQFALGFASAGVGAGNLQEATALVRDFAAATSQDATKAAEALAKAFADPAKGAVELNSQLHFLTAAQVQQITTMQEHGDRAGALKTLMDALATATANAAQHETGLAGAMHDVTTGFSNAADAIGKYIAKTLDLPEADARARLAQLQRQRAALVAQGPSDSMVVQPGDIPSTPAVSPAQLDQEIAAQQKLIDQQDARAKTAAASAASSQLRGAADGLNPQAAQIAQKQGQIDQLRSKLSDPAALQAAGVSHAQAEQDIADGEREIKSLQTRSEHLDKHGAALARDAAAMTANAQAALAAAAAYSQSDAAGGAEESRQKAVTEATRKGVPVGPEVARQQNDDAANAAKDGEKSAAQLRDETAALVARNAAVLAGAMTYKQATQAMEDQAKLFPILIKLGQGDAETQAATAKALADKTRELNASHTAEQQGALAQALSDQREKSAEIDRQLALAALPKGSRQHDDAAAALQAQAELRQKEVTDFTTPGAQTYITGAVSDAGKARAAASASYATDTLSAQQKATQEIQEQIALVTMGAVEQASALALLKQEQELRDHNVSASSAEGQAILASTANQARLNQALASAKSNYDELKQTGEGFIGTIGSALGNLDQGASAFSSAWLGAFKQIEQEAIKLAFINPLENSLFNQSLPTLGSSSSMFASLFGGSPNLGPLSLPLTGNIPEAVGLPFSIPGFNAKGTSSWRGGRTWVGEHGPELVDLPAGSAVYNADRSRTMMAPPSATAQGGGSSSGGGDLHLHNNTGSPMKATQGKKSNGDMMVTLEPLFKQGLVGSARDGSLQRSLKMMPQMQKTRA